MSLCDAITNLLQQVIWALFLKKAPPCFFFLAGRHPAGVRGGPLQSATVENPGGAKKKILKPMAWFLQFGKHNSLFVLKKMDLTMNFNVMLWALIVLTCIKWSICTQRSPNIPCSRPTFLIIFVQFCQVLTPGVQEFAQTFSAAEPATSFADGQWVVCNVTKSIVWYHLVDHPLLADNDFPLWSTMYTSTFISSSHVLKEYSTEFTFWNISEGFDSHHFFSSQGLCCWGTHPRIEVMFSTLPGQLWHVESLES